MLLFTIVVSDIKRNDARRLKVRARTPRCFFIVATKSFAIVLRVLRLSTYRALKRYNRARKEKRNFGGYNKVHSSKVETNPSYLDKDRFLRNYVLKRELEIDRASFIRPSRVKRSG